MGYEKNDFTRVQNLMIENREWYFEFKDTSVINNLGLDKYSLHDFQKFERQNDIESIVCSIKRITLNNYFSDEKEMLHLAHSLFNREILTGENNSFGGNLFHITDKTLEERTMKIEAIIKKNTKE